MTMVAVAAVVRHPSGCVGSVIRRDTAMILTIYTRVRRSHVMIMMGVFTIYTVGPHCPWGSDNKAASSALLEAVAK